MKHTHPPTSPSRSHKNIPPKKLKTNIGTGVSTSSFAKFSFNKNGSVTKLAPVFIKKKNTKKKTSNTITAPSASITTKRCCNCPLFSLCKPNDCSCAKSECDCWDCESYRGRCQNWKPVSSPGKIPDMKSDTSSAKNNDSKQKLDSPSGEKKYGWCIIH